MVFAVSGMVAASAPDMAPAAVRAQLTARQSAMLAAELSAKISRVHVVEGGSFRAGEVIIAFDAALQAAQLERARAVLGAAEKTAAANARLLSLNSIGQLESELAQAEVLKARSEVAIAEAMLARCQIRAPFPGRVAELRVREQEFVQVGQSLLEIVGDSPPQIDFIVPSAWLGWLQPGLPLVLEVEDTGKTYSAAIERIGAKADPVSQSIKVVAVLTAAAPELIPGMSGTVVIARPGVSRAEP